MTPAPLSASDQNANGENSRRATAGAASGCVNDGIVTSSSQPKMTRNSTNPAPGKLTHRPNVTPSSGPPSVGTAICPTRMATWVGSLNAPYSGEPIG